MHVPTDYAEFLGNNQVLALSWVSSHTTDLRTVLDSTLILYCLNKSPVGVSVCVAGRGYEFLSQEDAKHH